MKHGQRRRLRAICRGLPADRKAAAAAANARRFLAWFPPDDPQALAAYCALDDECATDAVLRARWEKGLAVWLPRVAGPGGLHWHVVRGYHQLRPGAYGIAEPDPERVGAASLPEEAVVIVPGRGFTATGARLGQGGGFYDRLLATHRGSTVGWAFAEQLCEELPLEGHDIHLDAVVATGVWHPAAPRRSSAKLSARRE